jgi:Rrf2 family protein
MSVFSRGFPKHLISTTGEYALRAAVYLAQSYPNPQTSVQIAEATKVPVGYLSKVMQSLVRREVATSQRGLHGGFVLSREPDTITVLQVLDAADSAPERIRRCPLGLKGHVSLCPVHKLVDEAVAHVRLAFAKATLHDLTSSTEGSKPLCEEI